MFKVTLLEDEPGINMKKGLGREKRGKGDRRGRVQDGEGEFCHHLSLEDEDRENTLRKK